MIFFLRKTAKKGITVLPKSAAKPDMSIFYGTIVASVPDAVVHTSSKKELPKWHYTKDIISYFKKKVNPL